MNLADLMTGALPDGAGGGATVRRGGWPAGPLSGPLGATLVWSVLARTRALDWAILKAGGAPRVRAGAAHLVVAHPDGFDLLVLDPSALSRQARGASVTPEEEDLLEAWERCFSELARRLEAPRHSASSRARRSAGLRRRLASRARVPALTLCRSALRQRRFGVVVAPPPLTRRTGTAPLAAPDVRKGLRPGLAARHASGVLGTTFSLHAAERLAGRAIAVGDRVSVGGRAGTVRSVSRVSDSGFAELPSPVPGLRGPRAGGGVLPEPFEPLRFDRHATADQQTTLLAWDLELPLAPPGTTQLLYTTPDTRPGDSGAPLSRADGSPVGQAYGRTLPEQAAEFSSWVCVESLLDIHDLEPLAQL